MRRITKEEYIETIYLFEKKHGKAQTGQIAEHMDVKPPSVTEMLGKLQDEGLVKRIGFSFHDAPENLARLIDLDMFDLVICQYNYLDRSNAVGIRHAHEKGVGVVCMGPVGGGRLAGGRAGRRLRPPSP